MKSLENNSYAISLNKGKTWNIVEGEFIVDFNETSLKYKISGTIGKIKVHHNDSTLTLFNNVRLIIKDYLQLN